MFDKFRKPKITVDITPKTAVKIKSMGEPLPEPAPLLQAEPCLPYFFDQGDLTPYEEYKHWNSRGIGSLVPGVVAGGLAIEAFFTGGRKTGIVLAAISATCISTCRSAFESADQFKLEAQANIPATSHKPSI